MVFRKQWRENSLPGGGSLRPLGKAADLRNRFRATPLVPVTTPDARAHPPLLNEAVSKLGICDFSTAQIVDY